MVDGAHKSWLLRQGRKIAVLLVIFGVVGLLATAATLEYTAQPKFCSNCHIMTPYYKSWESSSHSFVPCIECHYEPGAIETFEGKFKALSQVAKYVTRTEGTKPWAEVSDQSCMRSGCHNKRLLQGTIQFGRVLFDHRVHLLETRRGMRLRCTTCHSQIVQGDHIRVTKSVCFVCHFRNTQADEGLAKCGTCHPAPSDPIQLGEFTFNHNEYLARGVACLDCHRDVTRGTGTVRRSRCGNCHNQAAHLERFEDTTFLHENHVTEHKVECFQCHDEIEHNLPPKEEHAKGECSACHEGLHAVQRKMYAGVGIDSVESRPSAMYLARVTCNGCHMPPMEEERQRTANAFGANEVGCLACHGIGFENMIDEWQTETRQALANIRGGLGELETIAALMPDRRDELKSLSNDADRQLKFVESDQSLGVHNYLYAVDVINSAAERVNEGFDIAGRPEKTIDLQLISPVDSSFNCAQLCHRGIEQSSLRFESLPFEHGTHVQDLGMDCDSCHDTTHHKVTSIKPADCASCHHENEGLECARCHSAVEEVYRTGREADAAQFNFMPDLECVDCHGTIEVGNTRELMKAACETCHEEGYGEFVGEWAEEARDVLRESRALTKEAGDMLRRARHERISVEQFQNVFQRMVEGIDALERGGGAHNPEFLSDELERLGTDLRREMREFATREM